MLNEKVFTPEWTVGIMLDMMGYCANDTILQRHIIDNSCGRGDMLMMATKRYCDAYKSKHGHTKGLADELSEYIHGIEIDEDLCLRCIDNLTDIAQQYTDEEVEWDVICDDAFSVKRFNGEMDFVIANPPYRKVHDFGDLRKKIKSTGVNSQGMTDIYISFIKIGIDMLSDGGRMCYITPSTWTTSVSGRDIREYITERVAISKLINCRHEKIFDKASTYPIIFVLDKEKTSKDVDLYELEGRKPVLMQTAPLNDYAIDGKFYFSDNISLLRSIMSHADDESGIVVRNGFATLNDRLFITTEPPEEAKNIIPCVKASKGLDTWIVFPYDNKGNPLDLSEMDKITTDRLENKAQELNLDTSKHKWWLYGRTQAITDTQTEKYAIGNLVSKNKQIKVKRATNGVGVYGGMYIKGVSKAMSPLLLYRVIVAFKNDHERFYQYASALGHCKSGGYYYVNTAEVQSYLNFLYDELGKTKLKSLKKILG